MFCLGGYLYKDLKVSCNYVLSLSSNIIFIFLSSLFAREQVTRQTYISTATRDIVGRDLRRESESPITSDLLGLAGTERISPTFSQLIPFPNRLLPRPFHFPQVAFSLHHTGVVV